MKKFILLSLLIIAGRAYDITTTWLYTPDLQNETNIIVNLFGIGWTGVILFQAVIVALVIYLLYYSLFRFTPPQPSQGNLTRTEYVSFLFFGNTNSFNKVFYSTPSNMPVLLASTGYIASYTLVCVSFIVGTSTTLLLLSESYKTVYKLGIPYVLFAVIAGLAAWFTFRFFDRLFLQYKNR